jgi:GNAT superfamily N-acetyltransferase
VHVIEDDRTGVFGFSVLGPCRDASLLGFAGEIQMLYLEPARMGCGFGSRLWRASRDALERRGFRWLVVWVVAGNGLARRFYEHVGLRADGARRHDKFDHQWVEVIRYAAPLAPVVDFSSLFGNNFSA